MIKVDKYTALQIEEYKGIFSLTEGWENQDGDFKLRWITEEFGQDKTPKKVPKRVKLGDMTTMIKVADALYAAAGKGEEDVPNF